MTDNIKLLKTKYISVGENKIPIKLTFRAMIDYEEMTGKSISSASGTEDVTKMMYCAVKAGAKATGINFTDSFEEFLDMVDNYPEAIVSFYQALASGEPEEKK